MGDGLESIGRKPRRNGAFHTQKIGMELIVALSGPFGTFGDAVQLLLASITCYCPLAAVVIYVNIRT
jgi:hypothetical protein